MSSYAQRPLGAGEGRAPARPIISGTSPSAGQGRPLPNHQGQSSATRSDRGYAQQQEQRYRELLRQEQQLQQLQKSESLTPPTVGGVSTSTTSTDIGLSAGQSIRRSTKSIRRLSAVRPGANQIAAMLDGDGTMPNITATTATSSNSQPRKDLPPLPGASGRPMPNPNNVSSNQGGNTAITIAVDTNSGTPQLGMRSAPGSRKNTLTDTVPNTNAQRSLFLQVGRDTKRALFPNEPITLEVLSQLFRNRFSRVASITSPLTIQIRDPMIGVFYLLEQVSDVRDKSVLRVRVPDDDPLDLLRNRVDLGFTGVSTSITDLRASFAKQHSLSQELKKTQDGLVLSQQEQQEKIERSLNQLEQLQQQVDEFRSESRNSVSTNDAPAKNVDTSVETKALQRDLRTLQEELASVRRAYDTFRKETCDIVDTLEKQCTELRSTLELECVRKSGSARAFITEGQTLMDTRTEAIVSRIEDAEDICNDIKLDLTQRRSIPSEARMKAVREALSTAEQELNSLNAMVEETRPKWKSAWECELQAVLNEQQFLKDQEELLLDLRDDTTRLTQLFDQLQQVIKIQSRKTTRKQPTLQVLPAEEGFLQLNQVMQEITCIEPDSNRRLQALEQAERMRRLELEQQVGEFEQELGEFVAEKKLRPTGGFEETERRREERRKETIKAMLASTQGR